jgi:hypothetical protein
MSARMKKALGYVIAVSVVMVLALVIVAACIPEARTAIVQGVAEAAGLGGILALLRQFWPPKKGAAAPKEGTDVPKTKSDILADDPQHSLDRLSDGARADLDARLDADAKRRSEDLARKYGGHNDPPVGT